MSLQSFHAFEISFQGTTLYDNTVDTVQAISSLPSVTNHCAVLTIDIYFAFPSLDMNSELFNSGWSPLSIGLNLFLGVSPGNIHL